MSVAAIQMRAHLRHRGLIFWSFFVPVLYYVPIITILTVRGKPSPGLALWSVVAMACAAAFFLASGQQEIFSRSTFHLLPGMARGMVTNQVRMGLGVGVMAVVAALVVPGLPAVTAGEPVRLVSMFCLAVLVYALVVQIALQFSHLSWLVFQLVWLQVFLVKPLSRIPAETVGRTLDHATLWAAAAAVAVFLVLQQVRSRGLHRRIAARPYLSIADVKNSEKVQEFKRLRGLHKAEKADGERVFASVLTAGLRRVADLRRTGRAARAMALEATLLAVFSGLPRRPWQVALWAAVLPLFMVMGGYFDARNIARETDLEAWFVGLPFMAAVWFAQVGVFLRHPAPGRLWNRATRRRALGPALVMILALQAATVAVLFGFGQAAARLLPPVAWQGADLHMVAPRWDAAAIVLLALPLQMVAIALWRNPRCLQVGQQIGTVSFFLLYGLVRILGPSHGWSVAGGLLLASGALLPLAWNWRVGRTDQA